MADKQDEDDNMDRIVPTTEPEPSEPEPVESYPTEQPPEPTPPMPPSALEKSDAEAAKFEVAPRVRLADIDAAIDGVFYATGAQIAGPATEGIVPLDTLTVCIVLLKNGFVIVGKSAPASPENFNAEYGKKLAYDDCRRQIWPLMGFALRDRLSSNAACVAATPNTMG